MEISYNHSTSTTGGACEAPLLFPKEGIHMSKNAKDLRRRPRNCSGITVVPVDNFDAKVRAARLVLSWIRMRLAKGEASLGKAQSDVSPSLGARQALGRLDASQRPATD